MITTGDLAAAQRLQAMSAAIRAYADQAPAITPTELVQAAWAPMHRVRMAVLEQCRSCCAILRVHRELQELLAAHRPRPSGRQHPTGQQRRGRVQPTPRPTSPARPRRAGRRVTGRRATRRSTPG